MATVSQHHTNVKNKKINNKKSSRISPDTCFGAICFPALLLSVLTHEVFCATQSTLTVMVGGYFKAHYCVDAVGTLQLGVHGLALCSTIQSDGETGYCNTPFLFCFFNNFVRHLRE